jgi:dUTP pyrophosphatase
VVIAKEGVKLPLIYKNAIIYPYTKGIAQILMVEVPVLDVVEIDYEDLLQIKSERGKGALGSSGK